MNVMATDIYIENGQLHIAINVEANGQSYAITTTMAVADAERAVTDEVPLTFDVVEL